MSIGYGIYCGNTAILGIYVEFQGGISGKWMVNYDKSSSLMARLNPGSQWVNMFFLSAGIPNNSLIAFIMHSYSDEAEPNVNRYIRYLHNMIPIIYKCHYTLYKQRCAQKKHKKSLKKSKNLRNFEQKTQRLGMVRGY